MIEINEDVKPYHQCSFCDTETKATHSITIKTSPNSSHSMRMCGYHVWKFVSDAEHQARKFYKEVN